jgi:cytochrome P450
MSQPRQIPAEIEIDLDHNSPMTSTEFDGVIRALVTTTPVARTRQYGGVWIFSRYEDATTILTDYENFSSLHDGVENDSFAERDRLQYPSDRVPRTGAAIPAQPVRFVPTESDPPMHTDIRKLEAPFFTPKAMRGKEEIIQKFADDCIDAIIEQGHLDFASDLAGPVPVMMTRQLIGFGVAGWQEQAATLHAMGIHPMASPEFPLSQFQAMQDQIHDLVVARNTEPKEDVASALVQGTILGQEVSVDEASTILNGLTFGSTDTTTGTLLHTLRWLSKHTDVRDQLIADRSLIPNALEEFLRFYPPVWGNMRVAARDMEFGGVSIKEGEPVLANQRGANLDASKFANPFEIDIFRPNANEHLSFSTGPHRCLGAPVAKLELRVMLNRILDRLPDFVVDEAGIVEYPVRRIDGFDKVPATFTPGKRLAA